MTPHCNIASFPANRIVTRRQAGGTTDAEAYYTRCFTINRHWKNSKISIIYQQHVANIAYTVSEKLCPKCEACNAY